MPYDNEELNVKNAECSKLWYEWYACWSDDKQSPEAKELRKKWCKCADEHAEMVHQEYLKMKEKYGDML